MKNILLFDTVECHKNLLPLSFTRPVSDFRIGIFSIREKWEHLLPGRYSYLCVEYLREKFKPCFEDVNLFINSRFLPDEPLVSAVVGLSEKEALFKSGELIAFFGSEDDFLNESFNIVEYTGDIIPVSYLYDVFLQNADQIRYDFNILTRGRNSAPIPESCMVIGSDSGNSVFIEDGAKVSGAIFNVENGPIYIGKGSEVMEGSLLRGPISLGSYSKINMGSKIYGGTTIGPYCKVGGEINNAVFFGYSNKAHDGFLGNAVIGEWCNIGAGTNASNLKNDYSKIRLWNYATHTFMRTELQFCGLMMGDHSKIGVNCMLNTATVIGVGVNIYGAGFPRVFIPSFTEGSPSGGFSDVPMKKFFDVASRAMSRRNVSFDDSDRRIFEAIRLVAARYK